MRIFALYAMATILALALGIAGWYFALEWLGAVIAEKVVEVLDARP